MTRRRSSLALIVLVLAGAVAISVITAITIGPADLSPVAVWRVIVDHLGGPASGEPLLRDHIVWELRFPRVLLAGMVGGGLAIVGAVMQTLTRNPLADPYLLGISSGASLGAVIVVISGIRVATVTLSTGAFVGAIGAFALVLLFGQSAGRITPTRMVLAGVAIAQACAAMTTLVILWVNEPHATQMITFWLSGSLAGADWDAVAVVAVVLAAVLALAMWHGRALNALAFGEDAAASLGVEVGRLRWMLLVATALLTGVLVSFSGAIGFVGLILPHAVRFVVGPDHRRVLPVAVLAGAIFLVWVDTIARAAFAPRELPVGVLTAIVGVPAFVVLMRRKEIRG